jgi:eukaryotic-like serine/threonine-protein kinase
MGRRMDELIGNRYEMQDPIGRGGMATIFRAVDLRMGRIVAVKVLREVYSSDPKFVTRFQREARAASALQHPNIVQVFDYGQSEESYYIVMEFVDGTDLRRYLKRHGVLAVDRAVAIAHDVALGLGAAHRLGIVHRDVKPQNVMLNESGLVKLTDFGIASMYKDVEAERLTTTGMTLGTVQYYAPEQAQGEIVAPSADVYALGIVLYEMLTGRTPFDGDTPVAIAMKHIQDEPEPPSVYNPRIPPGLERVIMRCLAKDPRDRFKDGDTLAYQLENYSRPSAGRRVSDPAAARSSQFAALGPRSDPRGQTGRGGAYGRPAPASGPRGRTGGDAPGYDAEFDGPLGLATRPAPPAGPTLPRTGSAGNGRRPDENKRGGAAAIVVVATTVLLLLLSCGLVFSLSGGTKLFAFGGPTPTATPKLTHVPDFKGKQYADAQTLASQFHLRVTETQVNSDLAPGTVVDQDKAANSSVQWDTLVTLSVSAGLAQVTVPDLVNKPYGDACAQLTAPDLNLTCDLQSQEFSSTIGAGKVIRTDPKAGAKVDQKSVVHLVVSRGVQPVTPTVTPTCAPTQVATPTPTPVAGC